MIILEFHQSWNILDFSDIDFAIQFFFRHQSQIE